MSSSFKETRMTKTEARYEFFLRVASLIVLCELKNIRIVPTSIYRSARQQASRYAQGRTKPGNIVTNCDGYNKKSMHQSWKAIDFAIMNVERNDFIWEDVSAYHVMGEIAEKIGLVWGYRWWQSGESRFKDIYHIQYK